MISFQHSEAFWRVVEDCLVEFHRYPVRTAVQAAGALRTRLQAAPPGLSGDLVYHAEPFDVACDIAGKEVSGYGIDLDYERLVALHFDGGRRLMAMRERPLPPRDKKPGN
ncbi:MAG TPA: hypothetical protein VHG91_19750 [Longimicrobium sp.]|nr:hypothetical protein [Longimicrobium sp.]